ncbi:MAG: YfiR family protein [Hyphomicrobiales bacterium]|nr:YfiR family protein [Hyphomicrobiales bacterium]
MAHAVMGAYLYHFLQLVDWPNSGRSGAMNLCVLGDESFAESLAPITSKKVHDRSIQLITSLKSPSAANDCQVLYLGDEHHTYIPDYLNATKSQPVLTVSNLPDFSKTGGMIEFVELQGRVRFILNTRQAKSNGFHLSSKILELAAETL